MTTLNIYKTYSFRDKDPVIDELRTIIDLGNRTKGRLGKADGAKLREISTDSTVSIACLHAWFYGKTRRPQHATIKAIVHAIGGKYEIVMPKKNGKG